MAEISLGDIPRSFYDAAANHFAHFSIGFIRVDETPNHENATLLGSGTLVVAGNVRAILTAHHVLEALPAMGRLGLVMSTNIHATTVDVEGLHYLMIDRGSDARNGPDIGAVILPPTISTAIGARKSFVNLDWHRERMLNDPPAVNDSLWIVYGYLGDRTRDHPGTNGYTRIKGFFGFSAVGWVEDAPCDNSYDYFSFPLSYGEGSEAPKDFGGTSGGGLWQVLGKLNTTGTPEAKEYLLSGVAYFQEPNSEGHSAIRCHGRRSVYDVAYWAIKRHAGN